MNSCTAVNLNSLYILTHDYEEAMKVKDILKSIEAGDGRVHFDIRGFYTVKLCNVREKWGEINEALDLTKHRLVEGK